jgi:hypothetical protein
MLHGMVDGIMEVGRNHQFVDGSVIQITIYLVMVKNVNLIIKMFNVRHEQSQKIQNIL